MKITLSVSKLGGTIPTYSLPAITTCRVNAPCANGCYATKQHFKTKSVKSCYEQNLQEFKDDPDKTFDEIIEWLSDEDVLYRYFRWFTSGDMPNYKFLLGIIKVAKSCPNTKFLLFTKRYEFVNYYLALGHKIPENLTIRFSHWGNQLKVPNPFNLNVAYVRFKGKESKLNENIPDDAHPCIKACRLCKACWSKEIKAVVFDKH